MSTILISTGVQFPDSTIQTTAFSGSGGGGYKLVSYTSPGTWDAATKIAAGLKAIKVTVIGAGGSSGASAYPPQYAPGGGSGGVAIYHAQAPVLSPSYAITAGPGASSFGATVTATAGGNGTSPNPTYPASAIPYPQGGAGGTASGGTINLPGQRGFSSGAGGSSPMGAGATPGAGVWPGTAAPSRAADGYGAGGAGGAPFNGANQPAGAGSPGIVIVEEYY